MAWTWDRSTRCNVVSRLKLRDDNTYWFVKLAYLFVCFISIDVSICLSVRLPVCFVSLSVCLSVCLSICPCILPFIHPSIHLSILIPIYLYVCINMCWCVCVCVGVCVWNIWTDVKLLLIVLTAGAHGILDLPCATKLWSWMGYQGWSPWRTCKIVITCCSGSASSVILPYCNHCVWMAPG